VKVVGQDHDGVDGKWMPGSRFAEGMTQACNVIGEKALAAVSQVDGKEVATAGNEVASIVGHGRIKAMGFASLNPSYKESNRPPTPRRVDRTP